MGGRWVQVSGEGPIIAQGEHGRRPRQGRRDEDTPGGPLSVTL
jgi:hypothetical protein